MAMKSGRQGAKRLKMGMIAIVGVFLLAGGGAWGEVVRFTTDDGVEIAAEFQRPPHHEGKAPVAILLHTYKGDRTNWAALTEKLNLAGVATLALDMRGYGDSGGKDKDKLKEQVIQRSPKLFNSMYLDAKAALEFLIKQDDLDPSRVALIGASVGCSVSLDYAARDKSVDAIVCLSPGMNYLGVDSTKAAPRITGRNVLLMATEAERKAVDELAKINPELTPKIVGPGKVHGTDMFGKIDGVEMMIVDFVVKSLGEPAEKPVYGHYEGEYHYDTYEKAERPDPTTVVHAIRVFSSAEEAEKRGLRKG